MEAMLTIAVATPDAGAIVLRQWHLKADRAEALAATLPPPHAEYVLNLDEAGTVEQFMAGVLSSTEVPPMSPGEHQ